MVQKRNLTKEKIIQTAFLLADEIGGYFQTPVNIEESFNFIIYE